MKLFHTRGRKPAAPVHALRRRLEILEDRTVPASLIIGDASATEGDTTIRYFDDVVPMQARLTGVRGLAVGPDGNLYASSHWTDQVLEYDGRTGAYLGVVIPAGANPSGTNPLQSPWALAFGPDGNLYVVGQISNNVLRYNMATGAVDEFIPSSAGVYQAKGLTFDAAGDLLVSNGDAGNTDTSPKGDVVLRFQGPNGAAPGAPLPAPGQMGAVFVPQRQRRSGPGVSTGLRPGRQPVCRRLPDPGRQPV
jgi:streptogramin lyase